MGKAPLVLIVSEHEWASRSLDSVLAPRGYGVVRAYTAQQALERAAGSDIDAVFIDRTLPDSDGARLCRQLLDRGLVSRTVPIMMVTSGVATRDERVEALNAGAWELLGLPLDAEELVLKVDRFVRAKLEADRAKDEALIDAITGLYSWEGVERRIREVAAAAERFGRPLACVVFTTPEEVSADAAGERVFLSDLAQRLRRTTRVSDVLGRIGPREFAVIAPDTTPEGAQVLADRLRAQLSSPWAGVSAAADMKEAGVDPVDLLIQAARAARDWQPPGLN